MKILQVTNFFKPSWESGGPARVAYEISKKLLKKCHEVTVYTTDGFKSRLDVDTNKPVIVDGIKTYYFRNFSSLLTIRMNLPIPYYLPLVAKDEIKNFDVIHIHEYRTMLGVVIHYYAKKNSIPYILQAHGSVLPFFQKQRLKKVFDIIFGYRILNDASKVIALTKTEAEQYKNMGVDENKIEIVPNGIDLSEYENLPKKGDFKSKYLIGDNEKIVLYIGRLHKSKGIGLLLEAIALLVNELENFKLVIVGPDDRYEPELKELVQSLKVKDKVLFTGLVTNDDKRAAFVDADVFVTPSFSGFPLTFLEACASETPIITTNKGDKIDWIHEKVGYVVEYDKEKLKDAILRTLNDEKLREKFGENCRKIMMEEFGWDKIVKEIECIYQTVLLVYTR
jgi:glycosyltransferase involved in cell wall biosynthesis